MIGSTRNVRVWAYTAACDLRKGYNGLYGLVKEKLQRDPLSGDMYLFVNARRTSCKVLLYDGTGLCLYCKRLENQKFARLWREPVAGAVTLTQSELALFLEGNQHVGYLDLSPPEVKPQPIGG